MALRKIYDWNRIRDALFQLHRELPGILQSVVLIGGGASWFYRETLRQWNDPDFVVKQFDESEESIWLSKDVDFMGLSVAEASEWLKAPWDETTHTFHFSGLEIDFLEAGLRLFSTEVLRSARIVVLPELSFNVVEASLLFLEKSELIRTKDRPQDRLHYQLLAEFLKCEFCRQVESTETLKANRWIARARDVKSTDLAFFERDPRVPRRLIPAIHTLASSEHRAIRHWAKHHLPGYTD